MGPCRRPDGLRVLNTRITVSAVDYHTAGEPFRIISGGVPAIYGDTVLDKRLYAMEKLDHIRELVINEPCGHADMYGCFITEPDDQGADFGAVFFHNAGYSNACGHGTIALTTWAPESGLVSVVEPKPASSLTFRRDGSNPFELPVVTLDEKDYRSLSTGEIVRVDATGNPETLLTDTD